MPYREIGIYFIELICKKYKHVLKFLNGIKSNTSTHLLIMAMETSGISQSWDSLLIYIVPGDEKRPQYMVMAVTVIAALLQEAFGLGLCSLLTLGIF